MDIQYNNVQTLLKSIMKIGVQIKKHIDFFRQDNLSIESAITKMAKIPRN